MLQLQLARAVNGLQMQRTHTGVLLCRYSAKLPTSCCTRLTPLTIRRPRVGLRLFPERRPLVSRQMGRVPARCWWQDTAVCTQLYGTFPEHAPRGKALAFESSNTECSLRMCVRI